MISSKDWPLNTIISLGGEYSVLLNQLHCQFLCLSGMRQFVDGHGYRSIREEIGLSLLSRLKGECDVDLRWCWFSRIVLSECGSALDSIRLLDCASRDGFSSLTVHRKSDGFGSTLTLNQTSLHNIFGGYTPCVWNSSLVDVFDDGSRSFILTMINLHNLGAPKFSLVKNKRAIFWLPGDGPTLYLNRRLVFE
jgi:hypothetical protein